MNLSRLFFFFTLSLSSIASSNTRDEEEYLFRMRNILKEALKLQDNRGVTFAVAGALPFAGTSLSLEAMNLGGNLSFYCSSAASLRIQNNASISGAVGRNYARGCEVARKYEGFSISLSGGAGVNVIAGASLAGTVSYTLDMQMLTDTVRTHFINNPWNLLTLLKEMSVFRVCLRNQELAAFLDAFILVTVQTVELGIPLLPDNSLRVEIIKELRKVKNTLNHARKSVSDYAEATDCGFRDIPEKLSANGEKMIQLFKTAFKESPNPAALVPGKEQIALMIESIVDQEHFPFLRKLLLEVVRRDLTNCNRVEVSGALAAATPSGVAFSLSASLKHIKQIGPVIPLRSFRESVVDRYVQKDGARNFFDDNVFVLKQLCKQGKCAWAVTKQIIKNPRESLTQAALKLQEKQAQVFASFLNGLKACTVDNYKDLLTEPFQLLKQSGVKYD